MCGIAVVRGDDAHRLVTDMLAVLDHRGPDHRGIHLDDGEGMALGHARLAIMDPEDGHQPMVDDDDFVVVANGEIYNHRELRDALPDTSFASGSDAEVYLPLHRDHGSDAVDRLDGMFAFVISDGERVVAGRDPIGIKPLYVGTRDDAVAFSSELKALTGRGWHDVRALPPGHVWVDGDVRRYYDLPGSTVELAVGDDAEQAVDDAVDVLRTTLDEAVRKRLMADVPVGAFLSGGLDSSIIAALAVRHVPDLQTFALGFEGSDDLVAARLVAEHLGTRHHEIVVPEDEILRVLPEVLYHLESWDADLVRSALPTYLVARFAAERVKVVLTGEGADELFAGYRYHLDYRDHPDALHAELHRSVSAMHDCNLQRVDRMTMAHSLEARVPFLDTDVIEAAMAIPATLKLRENADGVLVEKWILRRAFEHLLPPEIAWRTKSQFDEGSGSAERLEALAAEALADEAWAEWPETDAARLRSAETAWYFEQVREHYRDDWDIVSGNTSTWTDNRVRAA